MKWKLKQIIVPATAIILCTAMTGFSPSGMASVRTAAASDNTEAVIQSISMYGEGDESEAVISLTAPTTYTSFQTTSPLRLILDLSQTSLSEKAKQPLAASGNFSGLTVNSYKTEAGILSRVTFDLHKNIEPIIKASGREIRISFVKSASPVVSPAESTVSAAGNSAAPDNQIEKSSNAPPEVASSALAGSAAEVKKHALKSITSRKGTVLLAIEGGSPEYKVFKLNNPERMVIDLYGVTNEMSARIVPLNTAGIASARLGLYPDKTRIVLDAINGNFPQSKVVPNSEGLMLISGQGDEAEQSDLLARQKEQDSIAAKGAAAKKAAEENALKKAIEAKATEEKRVAAERKIKAAAEKAAAEKAAAEKAAAEKAAAEKAAAEKAATEKAAAEKAAAEKAAAEKAAAEKAAAEKAAAQEIKPAAALPKAAAAPKAGAASPKIVGSAGPAQVESIDFQVFEKLSRISIKIKGNATVDPLKVAPGFVTLTIKGSLLPKRLQRSLETGKFASPVLRITPVAAKTANSTDTIIRIAMRAPAKSQSRQEGDMVFVEFNHLESAAEKAGSEPLKTAPPTEKTTDSTKPAASRESELGTELSSPAEQPAIKPAGLGKTYKGRRVTLEFSDAEVRKIFQLLSEVSNKNFVLGDDVTGTISLKLVNVPWDQALDIILDTKGLDKREEGNIVIIRGKGKFKSLADEELEIKKTLYKSIELKTETFNVNYSDLAGIVTQFNALKTERGTISPDARTNKIIVKDIPLVIDEMRKLLTQLDIPEKQVMIEARIVEATSTFTRNLGVNWGVHYRDGSASFMGINQLDTGFGGLTSAPPTTGTGTSAGGNMGISFGTLTSNIQLDMRLNAAASAGMIKIVSTPKVATLNNKTAKITQGQQIPYTSSTSDKVETKFIEAALSLEVTPHINANGTIGMKIDAKNDSPGTSSGGGAPPINKKQATTEMLLRDGETTVIGGIYVDSDTEGNDGVPFLMDIPFFGKLFKSTNKSKAKSELLVFITPRILGSF